MLFLTIWDRCRNPGCVVWIPMYIWWFAPTIAPGTCLVKFWCDGVILAMWGGAQCCQLPRVKNCPEQLFHIVTYSAILKCFECLKMEWEKRSEPRGLRTIHDSGISHQFSRVHLEENCKFFKSKIQYILSACRLKQKRTTNILFFSQIFQGCRRVFVRKSEFLSLISGWSVDVDIIRCAMWREPPYRGFRARQKQPHKKWTAICLKQLRRRSMEEPWG